MSSPSVITQKDSSSGGEAAVLMSSCQFFGRNDGSCYERGVGETFNEQSWHVGRPGAVFRKRWCQQLVRAKCGHFIGCIVADMTSLTPISHDFEISVKKVERRVRHLDMMSHSQEMRRGWDGR